jgi:hypothetical protein
MASLSAPASWALLVGSLTACGGVAVIDPEDGTGGSASTITSVTSVSSTTSTTTSTSGPASVTTGPTVCSGFVDCCKQICVLLNGGPCPVGDCACDGGIPGDPSCENALTNWYSCVIATYPSSIVCGGGEPLPACGPCDQELVAAENACGFEFGCF